MAAFEVTTEDLSTIEIEGSKGICTTYTWAVPPNESFSDEMTSARQFLAEQKEEDIQQLKEEAEAVAA